MSKKWFPLISYGIVNVILTLIIKLTGAVTVNENNQSRNFFHPFMQTQIMIIGEGLCLIIYYLLQRNRSMDQSKQPAKISLCILPLFLDLSSSVLIFVAFNYLTGSVYSILSGQSIVFTAIFTKIILKKKITRAQIVGSLITTVSAVLAGIGQSFGDKQASEIDLMMLGILLMTVATAMQSILSIVFQSIYQKYDITPLQMVGYQGMVGTIFWTIFIIAINFLPCPFTDNHCVFDSNGNTHLEVYSTFFNQIGNNPYLLILNICFLIGVSRFSFDQSTVIATASAFTVCIIRISSNSLVWIVGVVLTVIGEGMPELNLQSLDWLVNGIKFIAFILSSIGLLTYYEFLFKGLLGQKKVENSLLSGSNQ